MPIARARPIRSPRLPSRIPPIAAPNISAAVNRANQSPPTVGVYRSPSRSLETDSDAWLWFTAVLRARVVLAEVIEPFVELGGTVTTASPSRPLLANVFDAGGFQITPGVRFHLGSFSPAIFVALRPSDEGGNATIGIDIAGATQRSRRRADRDMLDGF